MSEPKKGFVTVIIAAAGVFAAATALAQIDRANDRCDQRCSVTAVRNGGPERRIVVRRRALALIQEHDNVTERREQQPALRREERALPMTAPAFAIVALFAFLAGVAHTFGVVRGARFGAAL